MLIEEEKQRQEKLMQCLEQMAIECLNPTQISQMVLRFKDIYSNNFRHDYSDFFPFVVKIGHDEQNYTLDYLTANLEAMQNLVEERYIAGEKEFKGLYKPLKKLTDHINLEIGRYSYYSTNEQKWLDIEKKNQSLHDQLRVSTKDLELAKEKVDSVQTELIVVLSIFAAIVLAFSGSISVVGNALSSVENSSVFKAMLFLLVSGFIVFNTIFLLMYLVAKITNRNIYAHCKTPNCSCGVDGQPECCGINRVRKRLPYVFWINIILIILIILNILAWHFNIEYLFIPMN